MLVGFDLVEANEGRLIGRIAAIDDTTANLLFELEDGQLIPANDDLIVSINPADRTILMHLPEGLLDLNANA
jgi:16S rRNA processing protein RimM